MSFQGDVAGIGLGELLQGLARGGRDGVLTLDGDDRCAMLGLHKGQIHVLPAPDEDETIWRRRCEHAWADRQDPALETNRRLAIARVGRLETVYRMLAAPNLHFRFEQGPLPVPAQAVAGPTVAKGAPVSFGDVAPVAPQSSPWGPGMTVEVLLLEYARIADESSSGPASRLTAHDILRALDPGSTQGEQRSFLAECDGNSTLQEIADRLEITLSECRSLVGASMTAGRIRVAEARELLAAAQRELEVGRLGRAATRLTGWLETSPPGGPLMGDADLLLGEWHNGRLEPLLKHLRPRAARLLLRKLDFVHSNREATLRRWAALVEAHHADPIIQLHEIALRLTSASDPETRTFHDLLRMARDFREQGRDGRTRALLRLAATHLPSRPQTRVELGKHMLDSGLLDEGVRWLLDTARELADADKSERALVPIRIVLRRIPDHPEANELLIETRLLVKQRLRRRWSLISGVSLGVILSLTAFVRTHHRREMESRMAQVQEHMDDPALALKLLNDFFAREASEEVSELRESLEQLKDEAERKVLERWKGLFQAAEEECSFGDPVLGTRLAMELGDPPDVEDAPTAARQDLFGMLARRLTRESEELAYPASAGEEELRGEERFLERLGEIVRQIPPDVQSPEEGSFRFRMVEMQTAVTLRREQRAAEAVELRKRRLEEDQDILLASARAHDKAGDLERAINSYERLVQIDPTLNNLPEFRRELETVRAHWGGVKRAEELCSQGQHEAAEAALEGVCKRPVEHLMPWQVESRPSGAHVTLPDGSTQTTPFTMHSAFGERVELRFEYPRCEPRAFVTSKPRDLVLHLHSFSERSWPEGTDVEAAPVAVGEDHVVADRRGRLVRLDPRSKTSWEARLETLGGIARTPVFLPERPSMLLVISEDGVVWLVDAGTGNVEGRREIGSPPKKGPSRTRAGVTVSFADGRIGVWTNSLEPTFYRAESSVRGTESIDQTANTESATLSLLNRGVNSDLSLQSPWTEWTVTVKDEEYVITSSDGKSFSALRSGNWNFVAWESPKALLPQGRLWVSDALGLRSYLPQDAR